MSIRNELLEKQAGTVTETPGGSFVSTVSTTREDKKIALGGQFFNIDIVRDGIVPTGPAGDLEDTLYFSMVTGAKSVVIEGIFTDAQERSGAADARYAHDLFFYFSNSSKSDFTTTGGAPIVSTSLNSEYVNDSPEAELLGGITATVNSGRYDLRPLHYSSVINSQGNNRTRSDVATSFFSDGKVVVVAPNTTMLVQSTVSADNNVVVDLFTQFFFSEY